MTPKIENFILQFGEIVQEENFEFVNNLAIFYMNIFDS